MSDTKSKLSVAALQALGLGNDPTPQRHPKTTYYVDKDPGFCPDMQKNPGVRQKSGVRNLDKASVPIRLHSSSTTSMSMVGIPLGVPTRILVFIPMFSMFLEYWRPSGSGLTRFPPTPKYPDLS